MKQENQRENMEELWEKLKESAEAIEVPSALEPENIKKKLQVEKEKKKRASWRHLAEAAAAALVVIIGGAGLYGSMAGKNKTEMEKSTEAVISREEKETLDETSAESEIKEKKEKIGVFQLAKSYDDVYHAAVYGDNRRDIIFCLEEKEASGEFNSGTTTAPSDLENESSSLTESDHSGTNLQVEGVDESDFIKNDGNYLYLKDEDNISIVDIRSKKMKQVASVEPELNSSDSIQDMYVDGDRLYMILQGFETRLDKKDEKNEKEEKDVYFADEKAYTEFRTYDITEREKVKQIGSVRLDGYYNTSRKTGDYMYLFANQYMGNMTKDDKEDLIPEINGRKVSADCFYVQKNAVNELIAVSVNVKKPDEVADQVVLMNADMQLYMGTDSFCLYGQNYRDRSDRTNLVKFNYKDGKMDAAAATSVRGIIRDPFAISEDDGVLRVLTTDWGDSASKNYLFLLDENLKQLGSLRNLAAGEEIYAARYVGDIAYFITYHNTDPLFAVNISDPKNPKLLGQLKVTGFSDYLHPYGENRLLGIGYETDPKTSETLGIKLTMFDTSDPKNLKVLDTVTMKGDYCPAAAYYKCAMVDVSKNLIGFEVTDWGNGNGETDSSSYQVYSWETDHFVKQFSQKINLDEYYGIDCIRGAYAGKSFYLIMPCKSGYSVKSYDMEDKFKEIDEIKLK